MLLFNVYIKILVKEHRNKQIALNGNKNNYNLISTP